MRRHAKPCRTLRVNIRMRARMRAREASPLGNRFGTCGRFGTCQPCLNRLATLATSSPTLAPVAFFRPEATTSPTRQRFAQTRTGGTWAGGMVPSRPVSTRAPRGNSRVIEHSLFSLSESHSKR